MVVDTVVSCVVSLDMKRRAAVVFYFLFLMLCSFLVLCLIWVLCSFMVLVCSGCKKIIFVAILMMMAISSTAKVDVLFYLSITDILMIYALFNLLAFLVKYSLNEVSRGQRTTENVCYNVTLIRLKNLVLVIIMVLAMFKFEILKYGIVEFLLKRLSVLKKELRVHKEPQQLPSYFGTLKSQNQ